MVEIRGDENVTVYGRPLAARSIAPSSEHE